MSLIFATSDRREAEARMRAANEHLSDETIRRIGQLVEDGAVRVGDNSYHPPGSIFPDRELTPAERVEIASIAEAAYAEQAAVRSVGVSAPEETQ